MEPRVLDFSHNFMWLPKISHHYHTTSPFFTYLSLFFWIFHYTSHIFTFLHKNCPSPYFLKYHINWMCVVWLWIHAIHSTSPNFIKLHSTVILEYFQRKCSSSFSACQFHLSSLACDTVVIFPEVNTRSSTLSKFCKGLHCCCINVYLYPQIYCLWDTSALS